MEQHRGTQDWIDCLGHLRASGRAACLVVVSQVEGSAPREVGARMIVADGRLAWGTIGGGRLEHLAIEEATALLSTPSGPPETRRYPLSEKVGQCCGGRVSLFFEPFRWGRRTVAVFGAGHVGQALCGLAPWLGADVIAIDERAEADLEPRPLPLETRPYHLLHNDDPEEEMDRLPPDALVVVMTHHHALDQALIEHALVHHGFPYLGLIGSQRKWERFQARLSRRGISHEQLSRVTSPIGLGQSSKEPTAIALSAAAQLREVMEQLDCATPAVQLAD